MSFIPGKYFRNLQTISYPHGYVRTSMSTLPGPRIAIVHGGLTTLHEVLLFEKPMLIIMDPGHPEQQKQCKKDHEHRSRFGH